MIDFLHYCVDWNGIFPQLLPLFHRHADVLILLSLKKSKIMKSMTKILKTHLTNARIRDTPFLTLPDSSGVCLQRDFNPMLRHDLIYGISKQKYAIFQSTLTTVSN